MGVSATRTLAATLIAAATLSAQSDNLRLPLSGLLVDAETRAIRPIVGLPGSAYAGPATLASLDFAALSPDGRSALVRRDGATALARGLEATAEILPLADAAPTLAAFSEDSAALALLSGSSLSLYTGLAATPQLAASFDLGALTIRALAVTPDAASAFALTPDSLFLLKSGQEPRLLASLDQASALLLRGDTLFVADAGRNQILRLTGWDGAFAQSILAEEALGISGPAGLALAAKSNLLYVANATSRQLVALDLATGAQAAVYELDFTPSRLEPLAGSLLLLHPGLAGNAPAQLFDTAARRLFFVPVSAPAAEPVE